MAHLLTRLVRRKPELGCTIWPIYSLVYDLLWDGPATLALAHEIVSEASPALPVIEVGAGTGLITRALVEAGLDVTAYEPEPRMLTELVARLPDIPTEALALEDIPMSEGPKTVVAANVLHLVPDPVAALARLRLLAGEQGDVIVVTPMAGHTLAQVIAALRSLGVGRWQVARFGALQVLMGAFARLCGVTPKLEWAVAIRDSAAAAHSIEGGLFEFMRFQGGGSVQPPRSHHPGPE